MTQKTNIDITWTAERAGDGSGDTRHYGRTPNGVLVFRIDGTGTPDLRVFTTYAMSPSGTDRLVRVPARKLWHAKQDAEQEILHYSAEAWAQHLADLAERSSLAGRLTGGSAAGLSLAELREIHEDAQTDTAAGTCPTVQEHGGFRVGELVRWAPGSPDSTTWRIRTIYVPVAGEPYAGLEDPSPTVLGYRGTAAQLSRLVHALPEQPPAPDTPEYELDKLRGAFALTAQSRELHKGRADQAEYDLANARAAGEVLIRERDRLRELVRAVPSEAFRAAVHEALKLWVEGCMENDVALNRDRETDPERYVLMPENVRSIIDQACGSFGASPQRRDRDYSRYGREFDDVAQQWSALERGHDLVHPDRGQCGGVGSCATMRLAHDLMSQIEDHLNEWRNLA